MKTGRALTRVPVDADVRFQDDDAGFVEAYASTISLTGMFIRTQQPRPAGTRLQVELILSDGSLVAGDGEVAWSRPEEESEERPAGMGFLFAKFARDGRDIVLGTAYRAA